MVTYKVTETNVDGCGSNASEHICFFQDKPLTANEYAIFQTCLSNARTKGDEELWDTGERVEQAMKEFTEKTGIACDFNNPHCEGQFTF